MLNNLNLLPEFCIVLLLMRASAIKRYYATQNCGHVLGPDQLIVIEYDKHVEYDEKKGSDEQNLLPPHELRNTVWRCVIVVRGMPSSVTSQKYIGIEWRNFHIRDVDIDTVKHSVSECGKAYVTVYKGKDTLSPEETTICGKDTTRTFFEWKGDYVTFLFYADFRRNASWIPPSTTTTTTAKPNCTTVVTGDNTTVLPLCTTQKNAVKTTTPMDLYPYYPEVTFRIDVTSFDYDCKGSIEGEVIKCNESRRCLHDDLKCDYYFSHNCKSPSFPNDKTDQSRSYPALCFAKKTTTPLPTTTLPAPVEHFNWAPVAVGVVAGLLSALLCLWCCWRPGYIPWRLSRLRNMPFCSTQRCQMCRNRTLGCPLVQNCPGTEQELDSSKVSSTPRCFSPVSIIKDRNLQTTGNGQVPNGKAGNGNTSKRDGGNYNGYGMDPGNFATDWLKLITSDGAHLREQR